MSKSIVIIGGMGPQASLELHARILAMAARQGATNGSDYPQITHISVPVEDFISDEIHKDSAYAMLINATRGYIRSDDIVILACNTAHLLAIDIEKTLNITLRSLITCTIDEITAQKLTHVGLLASPTTIRTKLYESPLRARGIQVTTPTAAMYGELEQLIRSVIAGKASALLTAKMMHLVDYMIEKGCKAVILGCTELSVLNSGGNPGVIDPLDSITQLLLGEEL